MDILDILTANKVIDRKTLTAFREEMRSAHVSAEQVAKKHGVTDDALLAAKGQLLGIPTKSIKDKNIPFDVLQYIPEESAMHYRFVPIGVTENVLEVGVVDPDDIEGRDALTFIDVVQIGRAHV